MRDCGSRFRSYVGWALNHKTDLRAQYNILNTGTDQPYTEVTSHLHCAAAQVTAAHLVSCATERSQLKFQVQTNIYCNLRWLDVSKIGTLCMEAVTFVVIAYNFYWKEFANGVGDWVW